MFTDNEILRESAHIGEELINSSSFTEMDRKCLVVNQTVLDGDFSLKEALDLYEVPEKAFENYIVKDLLTKMQLSLSVFDAQNVAILAGIDFITEMYKKMLSPIDKEAVNVISHFEALSRQITEEHALV